MVTPYLVPAPEEMQLLHEPAPAQRAGAHPDQFAEFNQ